MSDLVLAIETSCDETAAAVVRDRHILSNIVASQAELHSVYGGVVPEVAARHHLITINAVVDQALHDAGVTLDDIHHVAVTRRPGLIGALLVGVATAKALAYATGKDLVMVDHIHGHIAACWLEPVALDPPFVALTASGGHTRLDLVEHYATPILLGQTLDDAAGEAIDKGARLLGIPYPGGPGLEALAREGNRTAFAFPVGLRGRGPKDLDFSFAGVKTALLYVVRDLGEQGTAARRADLAASYQEAIVRALADRLMRAADAYRVPVVSIGGGVAANGRLRELVVEGAAIRGLRVAIPDRTLCTDNAAMIAAAAAFTPAIPWPDYVGEDAIATAPPGGIAA
ncbi:MAG: tRNA (adenosine(37)-N6)-threonylcarbamoyltransferase complex transferase subunit TsaD [Thermoleophilia bacterium]|nr:tRNA (adenosine(37)-N6)-threonylcarbamoyltransferase complex transferase subunit TsaD [Thermoleophilia bacterium]